MRSSNGHQRKNMIRKLADSLTMFRLFAGLPVIWALCQGHIFIAWILILLSGISDIGDGYLARKAGGGSLWGARLDPLADKILLSAPLIWLAGKAFIPMWAIWLLLSRELIVTSWRSSKKKGGSASLGGKAKTILLFSSVLLMTWPINWGGFPFVDYLHKTGWYLFWPSLLMAIISAVEYLSPNQNVIRSKIRIY
mgnify:CR=1 FL=1